MRKIIYEACLTKAADPDFFTEMVRIIVKTNTEQPKLRFIFRMFAKFGEVIGKSQINTLIEIFELSPTHFNNASTVSEQEFIEFTSDCDLNFSLYEVAKYAIIGMIGLTPQNIQEERDSILSLLNQSRNLEQAIHQRLELCEPCFIIEKEFWDSWADNVSFKGNRSSFDTRSEKKRVIDNQSLVEEGHDHRIKESKNFNEDYVIVPKFVFNALSKWYTCNKVMQRTIIKSPTGAQSESGGSALFRKTIKNKVYELEQNPKLVYFEKIGENGEKPHLKCFQNQKIDKNYVRQVLKSDTIPFYELQVTR